MKLLCGTGCYHPVQMQITDHNILMLIPPHLCVTSRGAFRPGIRPTLPSATQFGGAFSWQYHLVASVVAHTFSVVTDLPWHVQKAVSHNSSANRANS